MLNRQHCVRPHLAGARKLDVHLACGECHGRALRDKLLRMADRQLAEDAAALDLAGAASCVALCAALVPGCARGSQCAAGVEGMKPRHDLSFALPVECSAMSTSAPGLCCLYASSSYTPAALHASIHTCLPMIDHSEIVIHDPRRTLTPAHGPICLA